MRLLQCSSRHIYRFRRADGQTLSSVSNFTFALAGWHVLRHQSPPRGSYSRGLEGVI